MKAQNGKVYETNYARAAAYFLGTCAPIPMESERLAAYRLITGIYEAVEENAGALGFKPSADVSFGAWEQQKGREKDVKLIRGAIAKVEELIAGLYRIIAAGEYDGNRIVLPEDMKISRALSAALAANSVRCEKNTVFMSEECCMGLTELAKISRNHIIHITDGPQEDKAFLFFSRCVFDTEENWIAKAFDDIIGANGQVLWLCERLEKLGYRRVDCFDGKNISLDYVKQHGKKDEPLKMAWSERTHSGISLTYENLRLEPAFFWVRMPMFKTVLSCADKLSENVRRFIAGQTKKCDGCRYCVQTDKTGTRPLAAIEVNGKALCPIFPGFSFNWHTLTPELAQNTAELLEELSKLDELK